jgi:Protein of unknown function (DUF1156)
MPYREKLIEVALPLKAINEASANENSLRHGDPSTQHLWCTRHCLTSPTSVRPHLPRDPGPGGTPVPCGASRGRGTCLCTPSLRERSRRATRGTIQSLGTSPDPCKTDPRLTVECGPVVRRVNGTVAGRPNLPRLPGASRAQRRCGRRGCASPRIHQRCTFLLSRSTLDVGSG